MSSSLREVRAGSESQPTLASVEQSLPPTDTAIVPTRLVPSPAHATVAEPDVHVPTEQLLGPPPRLSEGFLLRVGERVGNFVVRRPLARGGMGEVYLARDEALGRKVALKIITGEFVESLEARRRFLAEARATACFSHPNIITIFAVGEHDNLPYVALEYVQGHDLRQRMLERRMGVLEAVRIVASIADAVQEAHLHDIVHRDLKPENVLLADDGGVRVVDFGLAKSFHDPALRAPDDAPPPSSFPLEQTHGSVAGTPAYMAPEQWRADDVTGAADVWAMGIMLFELCSGARPFREQSSKDLEAEVCSERTAPALSEQEVPAPLATLVASCLRKAPADRPSAGKVAQLLRSLLRPTPSDTVARPFVGLASFTSQDAPLFLGRETEIASSVERLGRCGLVAVVGPSGAGKTSFVEAGVVPRLRESAPVLMVSMRPGERPFDSLANALTRAGIAVTADELRSETQQLGVLLRSARDGGDGRVLLFVDQLEELFTTAADRAERDAFLQALAHAADDPAEPVRVVYALRHDYLDRLAATRARVELLREVVLLGPPTREALREILVEPVRAAGHAYEDDALVEEMIDAVAGEIACLPLLQFAADELWSERDQARRLLTRAAYQRLGGLAGALAAYADEVLGGMSQAHVRLAREIMLRLITPERTRHARPRSAVLDGLGKEAAAVLDSLVTARLLSVRRDLQQPDDESAIVEITHESLISYWRTLSSWLEADRAELAFLADAGIAAERWSKRGERADDLWTGKALTEAEQTLLRCRAHVPEVVSRFLSAGRGRHDELARAARRRRIAGTLAAFVGLGAVAITLAWQGREADRQRIAAVSAQTSAEHAQARVLRESALAALEQGDVLTARAKARVALEAEDSPMARAVAWRARRAPLAWSARLNETVYDLAFSPDGTRVAAACKDGTVYLFDTVTAEAQLLRGHGDQVFGASFDPKTGALATSALDGSVIVWDVAGNVRYRHRLEGATTASFGPNGLLYVGTHDGATLELDAGTGSVRRRFQGDRQYVLAIAVDPTGARLATAAISGEARIWSLRTGALERTLAGHVGGASTVSFAPDGRTLVTGDERGARLWDAHSGAVVRTFVSRSRVRATAISPDGTRLATSEADGSVRLWELASGAVLQEIGAHDDQVPALAFDRTGAMLASGGWDTQLKLWRIGPRSVVGHAPRLGVEQVRFLDGERLVSAGNDGALLSWSLASGRAPSLLGQGVPQFALAVSTSGDRVASGGTDGLVKVWRLPGFEQAAPLAGHNSRIYAIAFANGPVALLASGAADGTLRLWDVDSGRELERLRAASAVTAVTFAPAGDRILFGTFAGEVDSWDWRSGDRRQLGAHGGKVESVAFLGETPLTTAWDGRVIAWDQPGGRALVTLTTRNYDLAVAPGGDRFAVAAADGVAHLYRSDGSLLRELRGHHGEVNAVSFDATGRLLATGSDDLTVRLWDADTGRAQWRGVASWDGGSAGAPVLLTQAGWTRFDGTAAAPPPWSARLTEALAQRARVATSDAAGNLCLELDGAVEWWSPTGTEPLGRSALATYENVVALDRGCAVLSGGKVSVLRERVDELAAVAGATGIAWSSGRLLVAGLEGVELFAPSLERVGRAPVGVLVEQMALDDAGRLIVAHRDGNVHVHEQRDGAWSPLTRLKRFAAVTPSRPTFVALGPPGTVLVGFASGLLGLWDLASGESVAHVRLHGGVRHVLQRGGRLYVGTELGDSIEWDIADLERDYCELLRQLWAEGEVAWLEGRVVRAPPPAGHRCAQ